MDTNENISDNRIVTTLRSAISVELFVLTVCLYLHREIQDVYSGELPTLPIQSHCRCPGSHPRVHPLAPLYCIPNDAEDTTSDRVSRLHPEAHPLSFINDNDISTSWVSHVFINITQLNQGVTISIDLENGQYQVI